MADYARFAKRTSKRYIEHLLYQHRGLRNGKFGKGAFIADAVYRNLTLKADPTTGLMQSWVNDPASADKVGRYRSGANIMALANTPFASLFTFSRASKKTDFDSLGNLVELANDTITQGYDPSTLLPAGWSLEGASANNLLWSEDFIQAPWNLDGATLTPASGAFKLVENAVAGVPHRVNQTIASLLTSTDYVVYVDAKAGERSWLGVALFDRANAANRVWFNLANGTIGTKSGNATPFVIPLGGGYYRCGLIANTGTGAGNPVVRLHIGNADGAVSYDGNGASGIYVARAQVEANYFASSYIKTGAAAASRAADSLSIGGSQFSNIFGNGAPQGCVIFDALIPTQSPSPAVNAIAYLTNGTAANALQLRPSTTGDLIGVRTAGGVTNQTLRAGTTPFGSAFRCGMRWGNGAMAVCLNGGAIASGAADLIAYNNLAFSAGASPSYILNGRIRFAAAVGFSPSDAMFQAACAPGADLEKILVY